MNAAIDRASNRLFAREKVTGSARYGADHCDPDMVHVRLVTAPHRGRIVAIDHEDADKLALAILTHETDIAIPDSVPFQGPKVAYPGEIIGAVAADTSRRADEAARALRFEIEAASWAPADLENGRDLADVDPIAMGDPDEAFATAHTKVEAVYTTPAQFHSAIEPHSAVVRWRKNDGPTNEPRVRVTMGSQFIPGAQHTLAKALDLDPADVLIETPFTGGAFGGRGTLIALTWIAAVVSRELGRPAKVEMTRAQTFGALTHRPPTRDRVCVACDASGRLTALDMHETSEVNREGSFHIPSPALAARMYGWNAIRTRQSVAEADVPAPGPMRSPEMPGLTALEATIDELAFAAGIDPLAMRLASDTDRDPVTGAPYSSRSFKHCLFAGAEAFGWDRWTPELRARWEDGLLIGMGMAGTIYPTYESPSAIRVTHHGDRVTISCTAHEIGVGITTVLRDEAARLFGLAADRVTVEHGRSDLPPSAIAAGSRQAASVGSSLVLAAREIEAKRRTGHDWPIEITSVHRPPGLDDDPIDDPATATAVMSDMVPADTMRAAHGAQFAEVSFDPRTHEVRVRRLVGAFAVGRVLNERLARSQLEGGMIWGASLTLLEGGERDPRTGGIVNASLGEYLIPTNADVPSVEAIIVPETDSDVNPAGVKGVGMIGVLGAGAAILNAIYHASGQRVREMPVTLDKFV